MYLESSQATCFLSQCMKRHTADYFLVHGKWQNRASPTLSAPWGCGENNVHALMIPLNAHPGVVT